MGGQRTDYVLVILSWTIFCFQMLKGKRGCTKAFYRSNDIFLFVYCDLTLYICMIHCKQQYPVNVQLRYRGI